MRMLKGLFWLAVVVAVFVGGYFLFRYVQRATSRSPAEAAQAAERTLGVVAERVRRGDVREVIWLTGEVEPAQAVDVAPEASGRLRRLRRPDGEAIEEGVSVTKGEVVAVLKQDRQKAAVALADAALEVARAARRSAEVDVKDARREKERWQELHRGGSATDRQLDQAVTAYERAQANLASAEAEVARAEAALQEARVHLEDVTVEAPFDGLVSRKYVDEGAYVNPSTPLFRMVDVSDVEVTGGAPGRYYARLIPGETTAELEVDAYPDVIFTGCVERVRPELNRRTRTVAVTVLLPNENDRLRPAMYARMRLIMDERKDVPVISDDAIIAETRTPNVYRVEDGKARRRAVQVGLEEGATNEVLDGLAEGDLVIVRGHELLHDGAPVRVEEVLE